MLASVSVLVLVLAGEMRSGFDGVVRMVLFEAVYCQLKRLWFKINLKYLRA